MTRKEQIKTLDDKIEVNKRQYDLDRINAELSAYSSGDLPKYEYLTKKDLGYKPDAFEQAKFEYSPLGKVFTDGLTKEDGSKKIGLFKRLKNIEDNLVEADDNDNKVGIFQIIKDIKDRGIKIDNDNEVIREIREHIQNLRNEGVRVNNFDEISSEVRNHIQNLKDDSINVNINNDQVNDLVNKIFKGIDKKGSTSKDSFSEDSFSEDSFSEDSFSEDSDIKSFLKEYKDKTIKTYYTSDIFGKNDINTEEISSAFTEYVNNEIKPNKFLQRYNVFIGDFNKFSKAMNKKEPGAVGPIRKNLLNYGNKLEKSYRKKF